jgi:hypothetical protein
VSGAGQWGISGDNTAPGVGALTQYAPDGNVAGNVIFLASSYGFPTRNYYPTSTSQIGFTDVTGSNFSLSASSPYRSKGTDGQDPGVAMNVLSSAISGVIIP